MLTRISELTRGAGTQCGQARTVFDEGNLIWIRRGTFHKKYKLFHDLTSALQRSHLRPSYSRDRLPVAGAAPRAHLRRAIQRRTKIARTLTRPEIGANQLTAVSVTTVQSVPCASRKMPPGLRRQSKNVMTDATTRPTKAPTSKPKIQILVFILRFVLRLVLLRLSHLPKSEP